LDFFRDLGLTILDRWQRSDFDARAFPDIAVAALRERPPSAHVAPLDVVRWVHETPSLVPQVDIEIKFGQPPITVFACERFHIDVLFWVDGTTTIHQHRFSGAFHVMEGSSIQSTYRFTTRRRYSQYLLAGKLELLDLELLTKGDVRPIHAGSELVHALFHLDRPSVSVVVRTPPDDFAGPQYQYSRAGLAFDPFVKNESITRKIQTIDLLHKLNHADFEPLARATVLKGDSLLAFQLLVHLIKRFERPEKYNEFLESVRPAHDELIEALKVYADEERRDEYIMTRRQFVKQPEHRFFLALLLNLREQRRILELVRRAFPEQQPVEAILRWVAELARLDAIHAWVADASKANGASDEQRILDFRLDETSMPMVRYLLEGMEDDSIVERLKEFAASGDRQEKRTELLATCMSVRRSLLRPLFVR
jgi:hypothetical protein